MTDILALIDRYGRDALKRLSTQAGNGNRDAAEILVKLAANCVWSRQQVKCPDCRACQGRTK